MKGYQGYCPSIVKGFNGIEHNCGYVGYEILAKGIFAKNSGYDPLAMRVKCRLCGFIYILFPLVKSKVTEIERIGG